MTRRVEDTVDLDIRILCTELTPLPFYADLKSCMTTRNLKLEDSKNVFYAVRIPSGN